MPDRNEFGDIIVSRDDEMMTEWKRAVLLDKKNPYAPRQTIDKKIAYFRFMNERKERILLLLNEACLICMGKGVIVMERNTKDTIPCPECGGRGKRRLR